MLEFVSVRPWKANYVAECCYRNEFMLTQPEMYGANTYDGQIGTILTERRLVYTELHESISGMRSCPNGVLMSVLHLSAASKAWHEGRDAIKKGSMPLAEELLTLPLRIVQLLRRTCELIDTKGRVYHFPYLFSSTHRYAPLPNLMWLLHAVVRADGDLRIVGEAPLAVLSLLGLLPWQLDTQKNYKHTDAILIKKVDDWLTDSDH
jgi:hypothetical protein